MDRPTVLHVVRDWVRPSERFVADAVRYATTTRAVVACEQRHRPSPASDVGVPALPVGSVLRRSHLPLDDAWRYRTTRTAIAGWAVAHRARVVHAHFGYWAHHAEAVARHLDLPWSVSLHGHDLLVEAAADPEQLARLATADLVVVPSRFLATRAAALGLPADRVVVLPSGVHLGEHPFRRRVPVAVPTVVFAGRFVAKKGVLDAIAAIDAARRHHDLRVLVVGTGPLEDRVREAATALGPGVEVRDGAVPGAVAAALAEADVLVTASRTAPDGDAETLGLVNLEAQAQGLPVVSTRHGGIPEAVSPDGAVLVDEGDVDALGRALTELLDQPERWAAMGTAGRRHVARHFEVGARVAALDAHWHALATGRPRPRPVGPATAPAPAAAAPTGPAPGASTAAAPRVSVVVVTHQRRELLRHTLDALAAQTWPELEVVVVDNGTTDGTTALLADRAAAGELDLVVLTNDHNASTSVARNDAAAATTGELLLFTDDDCRPVPTWAEVLVAGFDEDVALVQGRTTADPDAELLPLSRTQFTPAEYGLYETCNIAYRREAFLAAGGFDTGLADEVADVLGPRLGRFPFGEDTDLGWRVRRDHGTTRFLPTALVHHHVFPPDPALLLRRAGIAAAFPVLTRRVPELRDTFYWRRVFLGAHRARFLVAVLGGVVGLLRGRPGRAAVAVTPYLWSVLAPLRAGRRARLRALGVFLARDTVEEVALVRGSLRARTPVL